ncbi:glycoside hydrolase family 20 zincin-like fold domain-containing protein [Phycisphaerales bacterium AB-hyl4]|uniref:beta-N-acetylhexosaminidase n=1 Tax=Natronomicrosphaera hydrolytica TaxID=3242702 RepID=A0ABV4U9Q8_9BACT
MIQELLNPVVARISWFAMPGLVAVLTLLGVAEMTQAQLNAYRHRTGVLPEPQRTFSLQGERAFQFDEQTVLVVLNEEDRIGAELLADDLKHRAGLALAIVDDPAEAEGRSHVLISRADSESASSRDERLRRQIGETQAEGYRLFVQRNRVVIEGHDARGALYGVQTLRQLVRGDLSVPALAIRDWPEMEWRMAYGNFAGRVATSKELIDLYLESASAAKMNVVIMETLWNHHQNWWFNPTDERRRLGEYFFKRARELHIEPVPLVQGPGWGYGVTDLDPMLSEGIWIEDEPVQIKVAEPTALSKTNVVTNEHAPIIVKSEDGETRYEEGEDFRIIRGHTVRPYHAAHEPWKVQALEGGAIEDGQTVLVSYNHVTPHAHKAYCLSDPGSYEIVDRTIDNVMEIYQPEMVHIGHDEVWDLGTCSRCLESGKEGGELVLKHVLHVYERFKSHNPDVVILLWDDLLRHQRSGTSYGILYEHADELPKDLIVCPWIYHTSDEHFQQMQERLRHQTAMGFEVVGTPSGYWMENNLLWYQALQPYVANGTARGMMFTEWEAALNGSNMPAAAELMWSGRRTSRPVFDYLAALTARLKSQGFALTYPLDSVRQRQAVTALFTKAAEAGQSSVEAVKAFRTNVIGDTSILQEAYGRTNWANMAQSPIHVQQVAMVQRIPAFLEAVAYYIEASHRHHRGDRRQADEMLKEAISRLHTVGYLSFEEAEAFREQVGEGWIAPQDLLGFEVPVGTE